MQRALLSLCGALFMVLALAFGTVASVSAAGATVTVIRQRVVYVRAEGFAPRAVVDAWMVGPSGQLVPVNRTLRANVRGRLNFVRVMPRNSQQGEWTVHLRVRGAATPAVSTTFMLGTPSTPPPPPPPPDDVPSS